MPDSDFTLRYDPGPFPLVSGLELSVLEVVWGLRLGGFNPGSLLYSQLDGSLHTVRQGDGRLFLDPPCERIDHHARTPSAEAAD